MLNSITPVDTSVARSRNASEVEFSSSAVKVLCILNSSLISTGVVSEITVENY